MPSVVADLWDLLPDVGEIALLGPAFVALSGAYLYLAGLLKRDRGWRTGYTRKVFHLLVFMTAASVQATLGLPALFVFGVAASSVIFYALLRGDGHVLFEAMARESDAPRRAHYIVAPYIATLVGGVLSNLFFGANALCGYLVAGLGDAIGEPVGVRFGQHRYRVPSLGGVASHRSWEGSVAVFCVSLLAAAATQVLTRPAGISAGAVFVIAGAAALVEAMSPHGWDNLTMQLVPSGLAAWLG